MQLDVARETYWKSVETAILKGGAHDAAMWKAYGDFVEAQCSELYSSIFGRQKQEPEVVYDPFYFTFSSEGTYHTSGFNVWSPLVIRIAALRHLGYV